MSPRVSGWKSQGETNTMSPSRIHTRLFSLPRILHNRSLPSWHLTNIRSKPSILTAIPSTSFLLGNNMFSKFSSLMTFLLPNFRTSRSEHGCLRVVTSQNDQRKSMLCDWTLPLENPNCWRMCRQVYRSMWADLWKRHLAQPCARSASVSSLWAFGLGALGIISTWEYHITGWRHWWALARFFLSSRLLVVPMLVSVQNRSSCPYFLIDWARVSRSMFYSKLVCLL